MFDLCQSTHLVRGGLYDVAPATPHSKSREETHFAAFDICAMKFARVRTLAMSINLDPLVSELEFKEQAVGYDRWFRAKVREAMVSGSSVPHDQAVAKISALLAEKRAARAGGPVD